jgi:hypothetical protein
MSKVIQKYKGKLKHKCVLKICYEIMNENEETEIFTKRFVKENKNKFKILYNNKLYDLTTHFTPKNNLKQYFIIKLIALYQFERLSCREMFKNIKSLSYNSKNNAP